MHLCFVSRIPRFNKRRTGNERLWHVLMILKDILKQFHLIKNSFRCTMIGKYRHTIPQTPNFDSISYCINLIPGNGAIPELLTTSRQTGFWENEHALSCFTVLVTVSKGTMSASACIELLAVFALQLLNYVQAFWYLTKWTRYLMFYCLSNCF